MKKKHTIDMYELIENKSGKFCHKCDLGLRFRNDFNRHLCEKYGDKCKPKEFVYKRKKQQKHKPGEQLKLF